VTTPPEDVRRLAEERAARRAGHEFEAADDLRDRIAEAGFRVADRPDGGYELTPLEPRPTRRLRPSEVPSVLAEAPTAEWTIHWLHQGWPEDIVRGAASFERAAGGRTVHQVVVEAEPAPEGTWAHGLEVVPLDRDPGFGAARNAGLRRSRGRLVAIADGSIEGRGDVFGPLERALEDPTVGVAGPFGLVTEDLREFRPGAGSEVDAVEGYLMALRREVLERGVGFDPRYRFYRAADVDLSFQIKAMGLRAVRVEVPVRRHDHRAWTETPAERRAALSKRNFYRFLDRFRGRMDLLVRRG
jgi:hypothetical protein